MMWPPVGRPDGVDYCALLVITEKQSLPYSVFPTARSYVCCFFKLTLPTSHVSPSDNGTIIISLYLGRNISGHMTWLAFCSDPDSRIVVNVFRMPWGSSWTRAYISPSLYVQASHDCVSLWVHWTVNPTLAAQAHGPLELQSPPPLKSPEQRHPRNYPADQHVILLGE